MCFLQQVNFYAVYTHAAHAIAAFHVYRVAQAYVNQRKLDHEVKTLQVQASQFSKQTAQWISMVEGFNQALKVGSTVSEI